MRTRYGAKWYRCGALDIELEPRGMDYLGHVYRRGQEVWWTEVSYDTGPLQAAREVIEIGRDLGGDVDGAAYDDRGVPVVKEMDTP